MSYSPHEAITLSREDATNRYPLRRRAFVYSDGSIFMHSANGVGIICHFLSICAKLFRSSNYYVVAGMVKVYEPSDIFACVVS